MSCYVHVIPMIVMSLVGDQYRHSCLAIERALLLNTVKLLLDDKCVEISHLA